MSSTLGERLRTIRDVVLKEARGVTAEKLGVSLVTLQNYENGTRDPSATFVVSFAELAGVSLNWLLLGQGPMLKNDVASLVSGQSEAEGTSTAEGIEWQAAMAGLCARALDEWLIEQRRTMPPQIKQETIKVLYKYLKDRKNVDMAEVSSLLRALAA